MSERDLKRLRRAQAQIRQFPDPVLRQPARPVEAFDEELDALVQRMTQLMHDARGAGLAASQIGLLRRVFVYHTPDGDDVALINPIIALHSDETITDAEGCLSLAVLLDADHHVPVDRYAQVTIEAFDEHGAAIERVAEGAEARVIQHELDHLDGTLILDRTTNEARRDAMRILRGALV
jgi:peptide deformylase